MLEMIKDGIMGIIGLFIALAMIVVAICIAILPYILIIVGSGMILNWMGII